MSLTIERTWQFAVNQATDPTSTTTNWKGTVWLIKAFLKGDFSGTSGANYVSHTNGALSTLSGLWTCDSSCDSATAGTAGDGIDRWGTVGSSTGNTGTVASITTGATIQGAIRLTGLTGMTSGSVGNKMTISGASSSANNSKTSTPWVIVQYNSATSVDIFNPAGVTGDANNGAITWTERGAYTVTAANLVGAADGVAHSWFVLKSPPQIGTWYLIIDMNSATIGQVSFALAHTQPTGGTTTARPTAVDQMQPTSWINSAIYTSAQGRVSAGLSTNGDFHFIYSADLTGPGGGTIFQILSEAKANDQFPIVMIHRSGTTPFSVTNTAASNTTMANRDSENRVSLAPLCCPGFARNASTAMFSTMTLNDFVDGNYDELPIYIFNNQAGYRSIRGRLADFTWAPTALVFGETQPIGGPVQKTLLGNMWVPMPTNVIY